LADQHEEIKMQIYMLSFTGVDLFPLLFKLACLTAVSGKSAEIGDLVLGIIAVQKGLTTFTAEVLDESASFASVGNRKFGHTRCSRPDPEQPKP